MRIATTALGMVQNVLRIGEPWPSAIPLFILDTEHEWLKENKSWLSRYPDVRNAICDKSSALWQNADTDDKTLPKDLFSHLKIDNNKADQESRLGWTNTADRLREMNNCPAALEDVRHLYIDIFVHDSQWSNYRENTMPPAEVPRLMAEVLSSMTNLQRLDFGVSGESSAAFEKAFAEMNVTLPSVTYLQPGAYSEWLLPRCPNVEVVAAGGFFDHWSWNSGTDYSSGLRERKGDKHEALIEAMRGLPIKTLKLDCSTRGWDVNLLELILDAVPNITVLEMAGSLNRYNMMDLPEGEAFRRYLSVISQFAHLEELRLPDSSKLDLGFDGGPWCGNAYFGEGGRELRRQVIRRGAETTEKAARIVREILPSLKCFTIGSERPNITLGGDGDVELVWPWTGKMEEYLGMQPN